MNRNFRKPLKYIHWGLVSLMTIILMWLTPLAFPHPLFEHEYNVGGLTFYSDGEFDTEMQAVAQEVDRRLQAVEIYDSQVELDVFLCKSPRLYGFFAGLTRVPPKAPWFNLSQADNSFVSLSLLEERRLNTGEWLEYSAINGKIVHCVAHELVHDCAVARLGFFEAQKVPSWKSEGYAEYAAGLAARWDDPEASLSNRIEDMKSGLMTARAREYYSWSLVVEYLGDY